MSDDPAGIESIEILGPHAGRTRSVAGRVAVFLGLVTFVGVLTALIIHGLQNGSKEAFQRSVGMPPKTSRQGHFGTLAERLVKKHVLENEDDPASVQFALFDTWNALDDPEVIDSVQEGGLFSPQEMAEIKKQGWGYVRVRYRANNRNGALQLLDTIYFVSNEQVSWFDSNKSGDQWVGQVKDTIASAIVFGKDYKEFLKLLSPPGELLHKMKEARGQ
jgi:hypothetical protein